MFIDIVILFSIFVKRYFLFPISGTAHSGLRSTDPIFVFCPRYVQRKLHTPDIRNSKMRRFLKVVPSIFCSHRDKEKNKDILYIFPVFPPTFSQTSLLSPHFSKKKTLSQPYQVSIHPYNKNRRDKHYHHLQLQNSSCNNRSCHILLPDILLPSAQDSKTCEYQHLLRLYNPHTTNKL